MAKYRRLREIEAEMVAEAAAAELWSDLHPEESTDLDRPERDSEGSDVVAFVDAEFIQKLVLGALDLDPSKQEKVEVVLAGMKQIHQEMLQRRYLEAMTLEAMAEEEGVTRQAVFTRLQRAIQAFQEGWDNYEA